MGSIPFRSPCNKPRSRSGSALPLNCPSVLKRLCVLSCGPEMNRRLVQLAWPLLHPQTAGRGSSQSQWPWVLDERWWKMDECICFAHKTKKKKKTFCGLISAGNCSLFIFNFFFFLQQQDSNLDFFRNCFTPLKTIRLPQMCFCLQWIKKRFGPLKLPKYWILKKIEQQEALSQIVTVCASERHVALIALLRIHFPFLA